MGRSPRFSNGNKTLGGLLDDRKKSLAGRAAFGKRASQPGQDLSAQLFRLSILGAEVGLLFGGNAEDDGGVVSLSSESEPSLTIGTDAGRSLKVEVDAETGFYVLHEDGDAAGCIIITASEERLLDHIVSQLASGFDDLAPRTLDAAVDLLVGRSLEEVEWRLILRTLRQFRGDLSSAAFSLGMPIEALQSKVRVQLLTRSHVPSSAQERQ